MAGAGWTCGDGGIEGMGAGRRVAALFPGDLAVPALFMAVTMTTSMAAAVTASSPHLSSSLLSLRSLLQFCFFCMAAIVHFIGFLHFSFVYFQTHRFPFLSHASSSTNKINKKRYGCRRRPFFTLYSSLCTVCAGAIIGL